MLDLDRDSGESLSGRIARIVEHYRQITADHCSELSRASGKDADQALDLALSIVKNPRVPLERSC